MHSLRNTIRTSLTLLATLSLAVTALGQDWPTFHGSNGRTGTNGDVLLSGPGAGNIRWFYPNQFEPAPDAIVRNNSSTQAFFVGGWFGSTPLDEASGYYPVEPNAAPEVGPEPDLDPPLNQPTYYYTGLTASQTRKINVGYDPTVPQAGVARTFTWRFVPPIADQFTSRNYALYVWVPQGPTELAPFLFPQRYCVYEVRYGTNQRFVDVVDTWQGGWIRIGNGGGPTKRTFAYDGDPANPITITLYNTVPRGEDGVLLDHAQNNQNQVRTDGAVYADAALAVPDFGSYAATPSVRLNPNIPGLNSPIRTVAAFNRSLPDTDSDPQLTSEVAAGEVSSYDNGSGQRKWKLSLSQLRSVNAVVDNTEAASTPGWTVSTTPYGHQGDNYLTTGVVSPAATQSATFKPNLADDDYTVEIYCPGPPDVTGSPALAKGQVVQIREGLVTTNVVVDMTQGPGWIAIGGRKFAHRAATGDPLSVVVTNVSNDPTDLLPTPKNAYADSVRFSKTVVPAVKSSPIQATVRVRYSPLEVVPPLRDVVIIAAEDGRIYCVDANGNPDGTTNIIWTYPSLPDPTNPSAIDPNVDVPTGAPIASKLDGENGTMLAEMPTGFDTSSALVQNVGGEDLLYIAGTNGRVYCIEMIGRGDVDFLNKKAGTTKRRWTYPNDYPMTKQPALGKFVGSVAYSNVAGGIVYAPDSQGRMYALDAAGVPTNRITKVVWTYPALNQPTLGPITTTPSIGFTPERLYFGTSAKDDTVTGQLFCLDPATGTVVWSLNGGTVPFDDFYGAAALATDAELGGGSGDMLFVSNANGTVYGISSAGVIQWESTELNSFAVAPLSITQMSVPDGTSTAGVANYFNRTILEVPTTDGIFYGLFARTSDLNLFGSRLAWGYNAVGEGQTAGLAVGRNWMYGADTSGDLFAFNDGAGIVSGFGRPRGARIIPPNDPLGNVFRNGKILLLTDEGARRLKLPPSDVNRLTYADVTAGGSPYVLNRNPLALEWGETAHFLIYDIPYLTQTPNGTPVAPPRVQYQITTNGRAGRQIPTNVRQFKNPAPPNDGYAVVDFVVQGYGPDGVPPGSGKISFNIRTQALTDAAVDQLVALDPTKNFREFFVANPIAIGMKLLNPNNGVNIGNVDANRAIGLSTNPADPENRINGSPQVGAKRTDLLATSPGVLNHGGSGISEFYVIDRSLMTKLRGPGNGLYQVRMDRNDLAWQGAGASVFKPIGAANYEDLPVNFPNNSLDYPNISRDRMKVTKDPNGTAENPLYGSGVSLTAPFLPDPNNPATRTMAPVPFDMQLDVPKYQPAPVGVGGFLDSGGTLLSNGYLARYHVYVDSNGDGSLGGYNNGREASRGFTFVNGVAVDQNLSVQTPTIDFGSLAHGTGFSTGFPGTGGSTFNPRNPAWTDLFRTFSVRNEGNVNLLNIRIAKGTTFNGGPFNPWPLFGTQTDDLAYLNGGLYILSDLDRNSASNYTLADTGLVPAGSLKLTPNTFLQKPRVGDRQGIELSTNPRRRQNAILDIAGTDADALIPGNPLFPVGALPRMAITIPLGFPAGSFSQVLRVIEDENDDEALAFDGFGSGLEPFGDPAITAKFKSRETRMTTTTTKQPRASTNPITPGDPLKAMTAPILDDLTPYNGPSSTFQYANTQPSGYRNPDGTLLVAYSSNRPTDSPAQPTSGSQNDQWRIYLGSLRGALPTTTAGFTPLRDLDAWVPAGPGQWMNRSPSTVNGYPAVNNALFNTQVGETLLPETAKFGSPALPQQGETFFPASTSTGPYMAFLGSIQKQTASGRTNDSRLFITRAAVNAGQATLAVPTSMPYDVSSPKGRPQLLQDGNVALILYSISGPAGSSAMWTAFDGTNWVKPTAFTVPSGFEGTSGPSGTLRSYTGANQPVDANGNAYPNVLDVTFSGRLRGRSTSEVFMARMGVGGTSILPGGNVWLSRRIREGLVAETEPGVYRALGLGWNPTATFTPLLNGGGAPSQQALLQLWVDSNRDNVAVDSEIQNLEVPGTRIVDRQTGAISFDCTLGGKAYLDPNLGTVRFSTARPARASVLLLSYQPYVMRVSTGAGASYGGSSILFDSRLTGLSPSPFNLAGGLYGPDFWKLSDNSFAVPTDPIRNDRFILGYVRSASGGGQAARPYLKSMRFGVQLGSNIYVRPDGSLLNPPGIPGASITVIGMPAGEFYQVDPAHGRVYFSRGMEDRTVTIQYTGVDGAGQPIFGPGGNPITVTTTVDLLTEREEAQMTLDQASNESALSMFLDPFDPAANNLNDRRPGLIWFFWSSTRAGNPDIYFQTLAPKFTPVVGGR